MRNDSVYVAKHGNDWFTCGYRFTNQDDAFQAAARMLRPQQNLLVHAFPVVCAGVKFGELFQVQYEFADIINCIKENQEKGEKQNENQS